MVNTPNTGASASVKVSGYDTAEEAEQAVVDQNHGNVEVTGSERWPNGDGTRDFIVHTRTVGRSGS